MLKPEGVAESEAGERRAAARIVDDLSHDTLEVAIALTEVKGPESRRTLAVVRVGLEYGPRSLTLRTDHSTHLGEIRCVGFGGRGRGTAGVCWLEKWWEIDIGFRDMLG